MGQMDKNILDLYNKKVNTCMEWGIIKFSFIKIKCYE